MRTRPPTQLYKDLSEALHFLPQTFLAKGQTLDAAFDDYRLHKTLSSSNLDLILMSYRYAHLFSVLVREFSTKKIKPPALLDLWLAGFTMLLTRDNTPGFAVVSEAVEVAKAKFGPHTASISNAFLRHIDRQRDDIFARVEASPQLMFPAWLVDRWGARFDLNALGKAFATRPESGVAGFDDALVHRRAEWSENVFADGKFQAMDRGSFAFCQWLSTRLSPTDRSFFDACAAPGGKSIYLLAHLASQGSSATTDYILCESKPARLRLLRENLARWDFAAGESHLQVVEWGRDPVPAALAQRGWDFALCDLPCSGSGTLLTRPDVLLRDLGASVANLAPIQQSILNAVLELKVKKLFVSVCSVDPVEIDAISKCLGRAPDFLPWQQELGVEGIVGWCCER